MPTPSCMPVTLTEVTPLANCTPSRNQVTFCVFGTGFGPVNENDCDAPSASVSDAAAGTCASMGSVLS